MTTPNIKFEVVLLCLATATLSGRNEPPKHDANLTFYVPELKPGPNDLKMTSNSDCLVGFTKSEFLGQSSVGATKNPSSKG